jgi:hypothetical protein
LTQTQAKTLLPDTDQFNSLLEAHSSDRWLSTEGKLANEKVCEEVGI